MRRTIILLLALSGCAADEERNAPPVSDARGPSAPISACEAFERCAVDCGGIVFGDEAMTAYEQIACFSQCVEPPRPTDARTWGLACMHGDDDLCEQGAEVCGDYLRHRDEKAGSR